MNQRAFIKRGGLLWARLYNNLNHRLNDFGFIVNRVEKIKHQYHVFQKSLVTTTDKFIKEGINNMETKPNLVKESINTFIAKNNIDTVNKTEKTKA